MYILGINDTHDSSACLIKDGKIVMALAEERITRTKNISSLPTNSIKHILNTFNLNGEDLDIVAVATKEAHHLNLLNIPADFTTQDWRKFHEEYYVPIIYDNKKIKIRDVFPKYKPSVKLGYSSKLAGVGLHKWMIKNDYPKGFQILCHSCNFTKGMKKNNNECPMKGKPH